MKRTVVFGIISMAAAMVLGPRAVLAVEVPEVEPNEPFAQAQRLSTFTNGTATVHAVMGELNAAVDVEDTDFFRFDVSVGDAVIVEVVDAIGGQDTFFPVIALFGPGGNLIKHHDFDTATGVRLINTLPVSAGTHTVGVTFTARQFDAAIGGGKLDFSLDLSGGTFFQNGDYTLIVSGVTQPAGSTPGTDPDTGTDAGDTGSGDTAIPVMIEVRPGKRNFVKLNPKSHATLKVAILSSDTFDARDVDTTSITFGATGDESSLKKCRKRMKDVNRDGYKDLICRFYINKAGFEVGDQGVVLKGSTITGAQLESHGSLKVKFEPRKHRGKHRHKHRRHKHRHHKHGHKGKHHDKDDHDDDDDKDDHDDDDDKDDHDDD